MSYIDDSDDLVEFLAYNRRCEARAQAIKLNCMKEIHVFSESGTKCVWCGARKSSPSPKTTAFEKKDDDPVSSSTPADREDH